MSEKYKPKYMPSNRALADGQKLAETGITNAELIDRVILHHREMTNDEMVTVMIAITMNGFEAARREQLEVMIAEVIPNLAKSIEADKKIEGWVDVGCPCPRCTKQRILQSDSPSGKTH